MIHRTLALAAYYSVVLLNLTHPILHGLGLEGGSLDMMLPYLNAYACQTCGNLE